MTFLIGEDVRVAAARNKILLGLEGKLVMETMHTLTIRTEAKRNVTIPKMGSALELLGGGRGGGLVLGDDMSGRLEDRILSTEKRANSNGKRLGRTR